MAKYQNVDLIFKDRKQAGKLLAQNLFSYKLEDPLVVALPRGGVIVADPIAKKLNAKLDILMAKKIGAPQNPELALGAVTSHGDFVVSPFTDLELGEKKWEFLQKQIVYLVDLCKEREKKYIGRELIQEDLYKNKSVILVDDGTATGMTALAAIKTIKKQDPKYLILAIPVISSQAYEEIKENVDKIEALKIPREFIAVGVHYKDFSPVTDDEIKILLV